MKLGIDNILANRYVLKKFIGAGGYSQVWLAYDSKAGNLHVAIKIFAPESGLDEKGLDLFSKEYALVFNLKHPGLLRPSHFDDFEGSPYLVMPYCCNGSVFNKIGEMNEKDLAVFLQQAASALAYLHEQDPPIIHHDIKPDNFLIDDKGNYLLADFGISSRIRRTLTKSMGDRSQSSGTTPYMAPERFSTKLAERAPTRAHDIFSLGVTLFELLTTDFPYGDLGGMTAATGIEPAELPDEFSSGLRYLINACLYKKPGLRPTAAQLYEAADIFLRTNKWPEIAKAETKPPQKPKPEPKAKKNAEHITEDISHKKVQNNVLFTDSAETSVRKFPLSAKIKIYGLSKFVMAIFLLAHLCLSFLLLNEYHVPSTNYIYEKNNNFEEILGYFWLLIIAYHIIFSTLLFLNKKFFPHYLSDPSEKKHLIFFSKKIFILGAFILIFLVIHLMHFFFVGKGWVSGPVGLDHHDFYQMAALLFQNKIYSFFYIAFFILLGYYIYRSLNSAFYLVGVLKNKNKKMINIISASYSILITIGFSINPIYFMFIY